MSSNSELSIIFKKFSNEHDNFEKIREDDRPSRRKDLCAFLLLDRLLSSDRRQNIVCEAEKEKFYLCIDYDQLAEVATEEDILYLVRCGVYHCEYSNALYMDA